MTDLKKGEKLQVSHKPFHAVTLKANAFRQRKSLTSLLAQYFVKRMNAQTAIMDSIGSKIEIEGTIEELQRIAIFLENNFIKHAVVDSREDDPMHAEWKEPIDWPLDPLIDIF